jgi:hypothetical protein
MILNDDELRMYRDRFLCRLYRTAQGIVDRRFNRYDIFMATGIDAITDVHQATDEIVQSLQNYGFIHTIDNEQITLSMAGLAEAERVCE